jgi:hypothetical protein
LCYLLNIFYAVMCSGSSSLIELYSSHWFTWHLDCNCSSHLSFIPSLCLLSDLGFTKICNRIKFIQVILVFLLPHWITDSWLNYVLQMHKNNGDQPLYWQVFTTEVLTGFYVQFLQVLWLTFCVQVSAIVSAGSYNQGSYWFLCTVLISFVTYFVFN